MSQNYRPFSWEEYQKNPELLRTRDGREVKQLTRFETTNWPLIGVLDQETKSWKDGGVYYSDKENHPSDLVLLNPPTETKKYRIVIHEAETGKIIEEHFVNKFCFFE